jgi:hypothetical protein
MDRGEVGTAQRQLNGVLQALAAGQQLLADVSLTDLEDWLQGLGWVQRLEVGLGLIARWSWWWQGGLLATDNEADEALMTLAFDAEDGMRRLIERSMSAVDDAALPPHLLEDMVLWAACGVLDYSDLWPRALVAERVRAGIKRGAVSSALVDALEILVYAERTAEAGRREPPSEADAIVALLRSPAVESATVRRQYSAGRRQLGTYLAEASERRDALSQGDIDAIPSVRSIVASPRLRGEVLETSLNYALWAVNRASDRGKELRFVEKVLLPLWLRILRETTPLEEDQWHRVIANPLTWHWDSMASAILEQLVRQDLHCQPHVRVRLAGVRGSIVVRAHGAEHGRVQKKIFEMLGEAVQAPERSLTRPRECFDRSYVSLILGRR